MFTVQSSLLPFLLSSSVSLLEDSHNAYHFTGSRAVLRYPSWHHQSILDDELVMTTGTIRREKPAVELDEMHVVNLPRSTYCKAFR